ncbi:MAG: hypothetical protein JWP04_1782 [Belnapia sp.]|nr:hypothetical protein [Belnapia sp.]
MIFRGLARATRIAALLALALAAPLPALAQVAAPAGAVHLFDLAADGVQIYACQPREGGAAWVFQAPEALLFDATGRQQGTHGAGPHWLLGDGSRVTGTVLETAPAAGSIPWLLLRAAPAEAPGRLRDVTLIRRFDTRGGTAPAGGCEPGQVARMRYSATYGFYGR